MPIQVEAIYEDGVLKPLQALDLPEHGHVCITVTPATPGIEDVDSLRKRLEGTGPAPGLEEVRRRLSKIPGSMTADFIAAREER